MANDNAATHWTQALLGWGIPGEIIAKAPQTPWIHPTDSFRPADDLFVDTPSQHRALEALQQVDDEPSLLDVGCGGGRATFGLMPPAVTVVGFDQQQSMLELFLHEAAIREVSARAIRGSWPSDADVAPRCDVVVCHHVVYNVADLTAFMAALTSHAERRVVVELTLRHPLSNLSTAWSRFWGLERPTSPTARDAFAVAQQIGLRAHYETFLAPDEKTEITERDVEHTRVRLCLPASRDSEVRDFLESRRNSPRELATIWWDK